MKAKSFLYVVIVLLCEITGIICFLSPTYIQRETKNELDLIESNLGASASYYVEDNTNLWYDKIVTENNLYNIVYHFFIPTKEERDKSKGIERMGDEVFDWMAKVIASAFDLFYWVIHRAVVLNLWLWQLTPAILLAFVDGYFVRKIKQTNFDFSSPAVHQYAWRLAGWGLAAMLIIFFWPKAVSPNYVPAGIAMIGIALGLSVGHIQKRI